jgi:flagellar basal-body rod protein FlgF
VDSGIYSAFSGLKAQMNALDIMANNLANVGTTGFKEEKPFFTVLEGEMGASSDPALNSAVNSHAVLMRGAMSLNEGPLALTNRDLDIAVNGNGFLCVKTSAGERYTRNGSLGLNSTGVLSTEDGWPVLGEDGPITLGPGKIVINEAGEVLLDGTRVDRLKLVTFEKPGLLEREGNSLFMAAGQTAQPAQPTVRQGYLEQSNVNPVTAVVGLVNITRQFESIQKSMNLLINDLDSKSIERLGR